ncbi:MAG: PRC-barrel domain-containing protein [Alkaliphilus sp.]|nr:PRC-barrel domain-containing protein [Alkaliphilus sp.]
MIKKASEIIGLPIICLNENCKFMEIKDLIYSQSKYKIEALVIQEGKYFQDRKAIIFQDVIKFEENSIIILNKDSIQSVKNNSNICDESSVIEDLFGIEVTVEGGFNIGLVQDITFETLSGKLEHLVVTEGIFDDLIEGRPLIPIENPLYMNQNSLIISSNSSEKIIYNTGGLKRILSME